MRLYYAVVVRHVPKLSEFFAGAAGLAVVRAMLSQATGSLDESLKKFCIPHFQFSR